jgi:aryl-alcohol dehydrogenase-like predicted oxidoreductase
MVNLYKKKIPKLNIETSALGVGTWAIGGPFLGADGLHHGWGKTDDEEAVKALRRAFELGVRVFDTADVYGCGHSEELIAKALGEYRDDIIIITKFGITYDPKAKRETGEDGSPKYVRKAVEASLKRLKTDYIDIYLLHIWGYPIDKAAETMDALDDLVSEGVIRGYGWSTDSTSRASAFADRRHYVAVESELNVFRITSEIISLCEKKQLANINRGPLAMGLLSGKYTPQMPQLPENDIRGSSPNWLVYFKNGKPTPEFAKKLEQIREILTEDGRTLVQGALGWIWAKSPMTIPIPGFKTVKQVEENAEALEYGPLKPSQMKAVDEILGPRDLIFE